MEWTEAVYRSAMTGQAILSAPLDPPVNSTIALGRTQFVNVSEGWQSR